MVWLAVAGYLFGGIAHGTKNVLARTLIHERAPERLHGRAFAAFNGLRNGAELVALTLGGVAISVLGRALDAGVCRRGAGGRGGGGAGVDAGAGSGCSCGRDGAGVGLSAPPANVNGGWVGEGVEVPRRSCGPVAASLARHALAPFSQCAVRSLQQRHGRPSYG